jgi:hypothetical protein
MCDCGPGYIKIADLGPALMLQPPQIDENSECYAARCAAFYANQAAFNATIAANLDPNCSECVDKSAGALAYIDWNLAEAQADTDYWNCRKLNG